MSSSASVVTAGDLDDDNTDDVIGVWMNGLWVKYSSTMAWEHLSASFPKDLSTGLFRAAVWTADAALNMNRKNPVGISTLKGPGDLSEYDDSSDEWPGESYAVYHEDDNLIPREAFSTEIRRTPGPGEPGFVYKVQKNLQPEQK